MGESEKKVALKNMRGLYNITDKLLVLLPIWHFCCIYFVIYFS